MYADYLNSIMATPTLTYFNARGRAEAIRLTLAQAGIKYKDNRVDFKDWGALKSTTPFGSMPTFADGKGATIAQSVAILRYIGSQNGLYGSSPNEGAQIDMIMDALTEMRTPVINSFFVKDSAKEVYQTEAEGARGKMLPALVKILNNNKQNGFYVGSKVSIADILSYDLITQFQFEEQGFLKDFPEIVAHTKKIGELPKIKEWVANRPRTEH